MKKLFKRIAPLLLALVIVLGSCLTVSAAESYSSDDKAALSAMLEYLKDKVDKDELVDYDYKVLLRKKISDSKYSYYLTVSDKPIFLQNNNAYLYEGTSVYSLSGYTGVTPDKISVSWKVSNSTTSGFKWRYDDSFSSYASNYDVYRWDDKSSLVTAKDTTGFFPTPPPLVVAVKGAAPEEALKEVILLIPLSILFLAGCLGLRKGLRLLLTLLHQA